MAEQNIGKIFVELDLDADRYLKGQQKLLKDATSTTLNIEDNFRKLGIRSSAEMDLMRQKISNSYNMIVNSAKATANDIVRAEAAKNAQLEALNVAQYGRHVGFMEKLKKNWMGMAATAYAVSAGVSKAWDMMEKAANYEQQKVAFANMAASHGANADKIVAKLKEASAGTIDTMTLIQKAGTAMMMGINPEQISRLMEIARATSKMTGQSVTEAFSDISLAVGRSSRMILDNLGIIVAIGPANDAYAAQLGKTSDSLTDVEKKQAFLNATVKAGDELIRRLGNQQDTARDKMDRLKVAADELQLWIGDKLLRAAALGASAFQTVASGATTVAAGFAKLMEYRTRLIAMSKMSSEEREGLRAQADEWKNTSTSLMESARDLAGQATENVKTALSAGDKSGAAMKKTASAVRNANDEIILSIQEREKAEKQALKGLEVASAERYDLERISAETWLKQQKAAGADAIVASREYYTKIETMMRTRYESERAAIIAHTIDAKDKTAALTELESKFTVDLAKEKAKQIDEELKIGAARQKSYSDYKDIVADASTFAATENERAIKAIIVSEENKQDALQKIFHAGAISVDEYYYAWLLLNDQKNRAILTQETENARKIADINADAIKGIRGHEEDAYNARIIQIDAQAAAWEAAGADHVRVAVWVRDETEKAYIAMAIASKDFHLGASAAWLELKRNAMTFGEAGYQIVTTFASESKTALSNIFFAAAKGEYESFGKFMRDFWDSMLRKITDIIAQMVVEWAAGTAAMKALQTGLNWVLDNTVGKLVNLGSTALGMGNVWTPSSAAGKAGGAGATATSGGWMSKISPGMAGGALAGIVTLLSGGNVAEAAGAGLGTWGGYAAGSAAGAAIGGGLGWIAGPIGAILGGFIGTTLGSFITAKREPTIRGGFRYGANVDLNQADLVNGAATGNTLPFDILTNPIYSGEGRFNYADKYRPEMAQTVMATLDATIGQTVRGISQYLHSLIDTGTITAADIPAGFLSKQFEVVLGLKEYPSGFQATIERNIKEWMDQIANEAMTLGERIDAKIMHTGGTVGDRTPTRSVPARTFTRAPRLHRGLDADEFPAILQAGETVIPKQSAGSKAYTINWNVNGSVLAKLLLEISRDGTPTIHERGLVMG